MKPNPSSIRQIVLVSALLASAAALVPSLARGGCGCDKPPPPLAAVRPFVGYANQKIILFDARLVPGSWYQVQFVSRVDGTNDWSSGMAKLRRDLTDGAPRPQLRVKVADVSFGPAAIRVWSNGILLYTLTDDQFTVTAQPLPLHEFNETVTRDGYQTGVGADGTVYFAVDVSEVNKATTFTGVGNGFPLTYGAANVSMYNKQGFFMQALDPTVPGLFRLTTGSSLTSDTLSYWRHEFETYKDKHRQYAGWNNDDDADWHADGSRHVDHDTIFVAIAGTLADGRRPAPGATPPFQLQVISSTAGL
jgi:hypothetical protein